MAVALRIALLVAWLIAVNLLITGSTEGWIAALAITPLVGALVARWWALLATVPLAVWFAIESRDSSEGGPSQALFLAAVFAVLMAVGIGIAMLVRKANGQPATHRVAGRAHS